MTEFSKFSPGQFSWVDLMTPNAEEAKRFYGELFGWDVIENPTDQGGVYTQFTLRDRHVAGMGEQSEEMKQAAVPAFWNSYVTVDNVDASAERATTLGGQLTMPVMQVMDAGRMAIIADPTGAQLSIWEPLEHIGAGIANESDSFCWNELATRDTQSARDFYQKLFGWDYEQIGDDATPYFEIKLGGGGNGGMTELRQDQADDVPSHWSVYFAVADCDASAEKVQSLGGQVFQPPTDMPAGRFATCTDPHGAAFTLIRLSESD